MTYDGSGIVYRWGVNKTTFHVKGEILTVKTRPIPLHRTKSIKIADINYVQSDYKITGFGYGKGNSYYTYITAQLTNSSSTVLIKMNGARREDDRLVSEINRLINKVPKPKDGSQSKYESKIVPPEEKHYVRKN